MQGGADASDDFAEKVEALIVKRNTARANKNWADADAARDELNALGVVLEDSAQGTTWRKA
jgi:cysteinyl-tRNA synthetase